MSYIATGITDEQAKKLQRGLDMQRVQDLPAEQKIDILLRHQQIQADRRRAFWEAVASGMTLLAFLGIAGRK